VATRNLGFRPLCLLASPFAAASVLLWVAQYAGRPGGAAHLASPVRHGHERVLGFAAAVIAGSLFTAVRNWTGRPAPACSARSQHPGITWSA
jgi:uncharacterized protein involved in response to NO